MLFACNEQHAKHVKKLATYVPTAFLFRPGCVPSWQGLGCAWPGSTDGVARTYSRKTEVHMTEPRREAHPPKRNGGAPTISASYLGTISLPVLSEVAKGGPSGNQGAPRRLRLPVYGNYCGLGHGDPTGNTPPSTRSMPFAGSTICATRSSATSTADATKTSSNVCQVP